MNPVCGSFARCVKHPSQFFTGFCATCLVERLSNVDSVENASFCVRSERVEISESVSDSQRKSGGVRVRKTLLSLFELDDLHELENKWYPSSRDIVSHDTCSEISELGLIFEPESKGLGVRTGPRLGASGSTGASQYASFDDKKLENLGDGSLKDNRISFWFQSRIPTKGLKWRRSTCKGGQMQEMCLDNGNGGSYMENKTDLQNSRDWRGFHNSSQISWEKPRHSWDGSMMSKALACSFSCLEEREDDSYKSKRSLPDEAATSDLQRPSGENDLTKGNNEILADHNTHPPEGSFRSLPIPKEVHNEDSWQDIAVSDVCRKKSNGWSRVWDWSITTPFREFAKKNGHVLERSLSESWRGRHKDNNAKTFHPNVEVEHNGNTLSNASFIRSSSSGIVAASGDRQGLRPDLQKMREFKLNRSHSVHFSSPRYPENGLLRFYLTPLRTSRRNTARSKRRTSHFLARGFLGL